MFEVKINNDIVTVTMTKDDLKKLSSLLENNFKAIREINEELIIMLKNNKDKTSIINKLIKSNRDYYISELCIKGINANINERRLEPVNGLVNELIGN